MATSLADLQRWRDALFEARLSGAKEFRDQNGESVRYASDREMAAALAAADRAIAEAQASQTPSTIVFRTSKGLI
jgi:predicted secreted acid phosphatase